MSKIIFHIDMNAFFASCEEIKRPFLASKPFAVGTRYSKKGVLSTANYIARGYGVRSAMTVGDALKKCPDLIIVDSDYSFYDECCHKFMAYLRKYTDLIEQASIDEAYLDVTNVDMHPLDLAKKIQKDLNEIYHLPCSIGIAPNLFLAKMGSDYKKPMGITVIRKRDIEKLLFHLDVFDMFGVGKKSSLALKELGIQTIGDLYHNLDIVKEKFGNRFYNDVKDKLEGRTSDIVDPNRYSTFASIGNSRTSNEPLETEEEIYEFLEYVTSLVARRIKSEHVYAHTISMQIKYTNFSVVMRSKTITEPTNDYLTILGIAKDLFDSAWNHKPVRLLGVSTSNLQKENAKVYDLFHLDNVNSEEKIKSVMDNINEKHGKNAIKKGFK